MRRLAKQLRRVLRGRGLPSASARTKATSPPALLLEVAQVLAGVVCREELSGLLLGRVQETLHARGAALLLPENDANLIVVESSGWSLGGEPPPHLPRKGQLAGRLLQANRPIDRRELTSTALDNLTEGEQWWLARPEAHLWIPLIRRGAYGRYIMGKLQGVLLYGARSGTAPEFSIADRRFLQALSFSAAVAAENIELVDALRGKAAEVNHLYLKILSSREEERKRIARELHDSVIQDLIDLLYRLDGPGLGEPSRETVFRTRVRRIIDRTRRLCAELRPPALDDLDLTLAIRGYVDEIREKFGLDIQLTINQDLRGRLELVCEESRVCLFRVLQEGLMNVQRHAGAKRVAIELRVEGQEIVLEVRDDGRGFDCPARLSALVHEGRFGLAGAQERVSLLHGVLEIQSERGGGTRLTARLPIALVG